MVCGDWEHLASCRCLRWRCAAGRGHSQTWVCNIVHRMLRKKDESETTMRFKRFCLRNTHTHTKIIKEPQRDRSHKIFSPTHHSPGRKESGSWLEEFLFFRSCQYHIHMTEIRNPFAKATQFVLVCLERRSSICKLVATGRCHDLTSYSAAVSW